MIYAHSTADHGKYDGQTISWQGLSCIMIVCFMIVWTAATKTPYFFLFQPLRLHMCPVYPDQQEHSGGPLRLV